MFSKAVPLKFQIIRLLLSPGRTKRKSRGPPRPPLTRVNHPFGGDLHWGEMVLIPNLGNPERGGVHTRCFRRLLVGLLLEAATELYIKKS